MKFDIKTVLVTFVAFGLAVALFLALGGEFSLTVALGMAAAFILVRVLMMALRRRRERVVT